VGDDGVQRPEAPVVVEAALGVREQAAQRRRPVSLVRRPLRLEVVDPDLGGGVHVPAGIRIERWHVAGRAFRRVLEERLPAARRCRPSAAREPARSRTYISISPLRSPSVTASTRLVTSSFW